MKKLILLVAAASVLTGCNIREQELRECQAKGVSRDACYIAQQNREAIEEAQSDAEFNRDVEKSHHKHHKHHSD